MDFLFDRTAEGRFQKCLAVVDDAIREVVVIEAERAISDIAVTRVLDRLALSRDLPRVIRNDNGYEFCGMAMVTWCHVCGMQAPDRTRQANEERPKKAFGELTPSAYAKQLK
jgi:putative transposase